MAKLKLLKAHDMKSVDPEIIEQIRNLSQDISIAICPLLHGVDANVILASFSWVHAAMIKRFVSDDDEELDKAAFSYASCLINDIKRLKDLHKQGKI
jgi:hypothetical protein